jgi:uncharacterized phage protein (TIGR01671 family)
MQREIKFRAHYKAKMWNATELRWSDGSITLYDPTTEDTCIAELSNVALMQFTGIHDKNGKEIYEGDIVRIGSKSPVEVRWHEASAGFLDIGMELMSGTEAIGSIYENPELLGANASGL